MLPSLSLLEQIQKHIFNIPNKRKESKKKEHYCLFLLGHKAGLRVSEAINFDISKKTQQVLYQITKTKGKKERYVYIPEQVIRELKANNWQPNRTNRFNFYHFLKSIKKELGISNNTELTPHTLRRAFATYHTEAGLPLPLLSKMLGHASVRTTALYWMNTYHGDDDDDSNAGAILAGKDWLKEHEENDPEQPKTPTINEIPPQLDRINLLIEPAKQKIDELTNALSHYQQQLTAKDKQITKLASKLNKAKEQNANLRNDLSELSQENAQEINQRQKIQQDLAKANQTIQQLEQDLIATQNNLAQEKQINTNLRQQLHAEQQNNQSLKEINTNLTQKLSNQEQTIANLQNAYQNALKDKEQANKQLNQLTREVKNFAKMLQQWQKINYYQQLEQQNELKAQIIQPPPWKTNK